MQVEKLENSNVKFVLDISAEEFEIGLKHSYNTNKSKYVIQGFRKGRVPRKLLEKWYGESILFEDAINHLLNIQYPIAVEELNLKVVSNPEFKIVSVSKEEGAKIEVIVTVVPGVTLGQYKGLTYTKEAIFVTEDEIEKEIETAREKNSRLVSVEDRPTQNGDIVTIDFKGFIDGEEFEGGAGTDYELELGSGTFIAGFEDQLLNHNLADDVKVDVTFPDDYPTLELAGHPAVFEVEIKDIRQKEYPEIDDDFAADVSEFDTLEAYKEDIRKTLANKKEEKAKKDIEDALLKKACDNSECDVPKAMVDRQVKIMAQEFEYRMRVQGSSLQMYLQFSGQTLDKFEEGLREPAAFAVKSRLVLEEIAKKEAFEVTDEEIDKELLRLAQSYNINESKIHEIFTPNDKEEITTDISVQKALDFIVETSVLEQQ